MSNPFQDAYSGLTGAAPTSGGSAVGTGAATNPFQDAYGAPAGPTAPSTNPFQDAYGTTTGAPASSTNPFQEAFGNLTAAATLAKTPLAKSSNPNLFHQLVNTAGATVGAVGSLAGEAAKETARYTVGGSENLINDVTAAVPGDYGTHLGNAEEQASGPVLPTQQQWTANLNANPVAGGMLRGFQQTGEEVAHPSRAITNYSKDPLMAALNDIGTISTVVPVVGETIHGLAAGGESTEALTAAAQAGEASTAAVRAAKVADIITKVGEFPTIGNLIGSSRGALAGLADRLAQDPELLHAVDDAATGAGQEAVAQSVSKLGPSSVLDQATQSMAKTLQQALDEGRVPAEQIGHAQAILADVANFASTADSTVAPSLVDAGAETIAQQADRDAAQQAVKGQRGTLAGALAKTGAGQWTDTKGALNTVVDMMSRLKSADSSVAAALKSGTDEIGIPLQEGGEIRINPADTRAVAAAKETLVNSTLQRLVQNPAVERINEVDVASLTASAKEAGKSLQDYVKSIGFTNLQDATNGRLNGELARTSFIPNSMAAQLSKYTDVVAEPGVVGNLLTKGTKITQMMKMAISPTTIINRIGHAGLIAADNPNTVDSLKLMGKSLFGKLSDDELADLQRTTMAQHGAVWEASAKAEATDTGRVRAIAETLTSLPDTLLQKSPFLRAARAVDNAARSGIWLAARQAGASPEDADLILGKTAGYFDRSTVAGRNIAKAIPFYNWNKQVLNVLTNMAEDHPGAFSEFTLAAANMAKYNAATGNTTGATAIGGHNVDLGFLSPFSNVSASLSPQELLSAPLKGLYPIATGTNPSGYAPSSPEGPVEGRGLHQVPAAEQNLLKSFPQAQATQGLVTGTAGEPRYGDGQLKALPGKADNLQAWAAMLGITESPVAAANAQSAATAKSAATAQKIEAGEKKSYLKKLAAAGK